MGNTVFETIWKLQDILLQYTLFFLPILVSKQKLRESHTNTDLKCQKNTFSSQNTERKQHKMIGIIYNPHAFMFELHSKRNSCIYLNYGCPCL